MSRLPRALVSVGAAAAALVLVAPTAALADSPHDAKDGGTTGSHGHGRADASAHHDPAGNNGTIKIEPFGTTDGHANHPHPGCGFRLQMFDFDDDQTGTITFTGQAPTKGAVTTQPLPGTQLLSDDPAQGGQDVDAFYDVTAASLGLTGTPAKQGWHIRVEVNADNAPGGAKTKVFWLSCPAAAAPVTAPATPTTSGSGTAVSTESLGGGTAVTAPATSTTTGVTALSNGGAVTALGNETSGFTGGGGTAVVTSPAGSATAATAGGSGGALPFTGIALGSLLAFALGAVGIGTLAVRAGRRRTSTV